MFHGFDMVPTYIVTAGSTEAGLLMLSGSAFQFFASESRFAVLEGRDFRSLDEAARAASSLGSPECCRCRIDVSPVP